jgi:hypothetical protein
MTRVMEARSGNFDVYVFWPRITVVDGRADWLAKTLGRKATPVPEALRGGSGLQLAQAFLEGEPETAVPVDQIMVNHAGTGAAPWPVLTLPAGVFWIRVIDAKGTVTGSVRLKL